MALPIGRLVRTAAKRIAADPKARATATKIGQSFAEEAKTIAADKDPARAAGRSVRRALAALRGKHGTGSGGTGT